MQKIKKSPKICVLKRNKTGKKEVFEKIVKEDLSIFNIPPTPAIIKNINYFFKEKLSNLEFLNEEMMKVYSRVFLYKMTLKTTGKKSVFFEGLKIKKAIFQRALEEINDWKEISEEVEEGREEICNLYKIC